MASTGLRTRATLVIGAATAMREAAILDAIANVSDRASLGAVDAIDAIDAEDNRHRPSRAVAVILEGLPDGTDRFSVEQADIAATRIAPACPCCIGNLVMRVTLNRILRHRPRHLYISLASDGHLAQFRQFLASAPYAALIELTEDLVAR